MPAGIKPFIGLWVDFELVTDCGSILHEINKIILYKSIRLILTEEGYNDNSYNSTTT